MNALLRELIFQVAVDAQIEITWPQSLMDRLQHPTLPRPLRFPTIKPPKHRARKKKRGRNDTLEGLEGKEE